MLRHLITVTMLSAIATLPTFEATKAASLKPDQSISIRFDNGSPPVKAGQPPLDFGESFELKPGEVFTVGGGVSFFAFTDFPQGVETVDFQLDINPGDSFLSLNLPGNFSVTTDEPQQTVASVEAGEALSIAYGYDAATETFASTQFRLKASEVAIVPRLPNAEHPPTAIPEPPLPVAMGLLAIGGMAYKLQRS